MKTVRVANIDKAASIKYSKKIKDFEKRIQILESQLAAVLQKLKHIDTAVQVVEVGEDDTN